MNKIETLETEDKIISSRKDTEKEGDLKTDPLTTAKTFYSMSFPVMISRLAMFTNFYNVAFSATLQSQTKIAAVGLANSILAIFATYFTFGFMVPLETLTSQAYGAGNLRLCGVYLNRAIILLHIAFIPMAIIFYNLEEILLKFK